PAPHAFPRDLQLVALPTHRPLQPADLPPQLPLAAALFLARQRPAAALQQLVAPGVEERVRDLVLTADVLHGPVAAQAGQHDLDLLMRRSSAVLTLLTLTRLLLRLYSHSYPYAGAVLHSNILTILYRL